MTQEMTQGAGDPVRLAQSAVQALYRTDRASQGLGLEIIGERVTATASEVTRTARNGIYDVCVTKSSGETIAHFRGRCSRLRVSTSNEAIR
jgi:hypothetical protein